MDLNKRGQFEVLWGVQFKAFMAELSPINVDLKLRLVQCDFEFSSVSRRRRGRKMVYRKRRELVSDSSTNHLL